MIYGTRSGRKMRQLRPNLIKDDILEIGVSENALSKKMKKNVEIRKKRQ